MQIILHALTLIATLNVGTLSAQSAAWPPFYRQPYKQRLAQSMVHGPTDLQGAQLEKSRENMQALSATPRCTPPPARNILRTYSGLQSASNKEANDLGIVFRQADGSPTPFLTGHVVLWRAGQYGTCTSVGGTTELVYGTELVVAFLLAPDQIVPRTIAQIENEILRRKVRALGVTLNGSTVPPILQQEIKELPSDILNSGNVQRFTALQNDWSRSPKDAPLSLLGILVSSPGS